MQIGDRVEWTSQSASFRTTKHGEIVAVVPAETPPERCIPGGMRCGSPTGFGMHRDHESYLVKVDGKGFGLYWPRVKHLRLSNAHGDGSAASADTVRRDVGQEVDNGL
jgi:hypothetical protein